MMATQIDGGEPLPTWLSTWWLLPSQAGQADVALSAPTHLESPLALVDLLRTAMPQKRLGLLVAPMRRYCGGGPAAGEFCPRTIPLMVCPYMSIGES
jgi:hypothetical protein